MSQILIIDDDKMLLEMLQEYLEDQGHLVLKAERAQEAVKLFRDTKPELVIIDIIMPKIDGLELLKNFKEIHSGFKSILLTGVSDERFKEKAQELGADRYLVKPVLLDNFKEIVNNLLLRS